MKDEEVNKCEFCGEIKSVSRYYIRIKNKHFDDNKKGKYSTYISYCNDCGIEPMLSSKHHSYLTDRIENRDKIRSIIAPLLIEELRRSGTMAKVAHAMLLSKMTDKLEAFLTDTITQAMEVGREEIVDIVKKQRNIIKDGMTMDERKSGYYLSGASRLEKRILTELKSLSSKQ